MLPNVTSAHSIEVFKILLVHNISLLWAYVCISAFLQYSCAHAFGMKFHRKKSSYIDRHVTFTAEWRGCKPIK